jgi:hypothetical protein
MELSQAEIERYAPYHTFPEFTFGYDDYMAKLPWPIARQDRGINPNSVGGQAYDRGLECAMRRRTAELRKQA